MSRRGAQLLLAAVLSLVVWMATGAGANAGVGGPDLVAVPGSDTGMLGSHADGGELDAHVAVVVRAHGDPSLLARVQRLVAIVVAVAGGGLALRNRWPGRRRFGWRDDAPVWSGWFADPGRLRGPPAI
jgi:hypothetical protein